MEETERIARLRSRLVKRLGRWLGNQGLAEDVFHDAFLKVLEGAGASRPESLLPWLELVVPTVAIDHLRREGSKAQRSGTETARLLRTTPNNVRVRLPRARAALAKAVRRACGPCARDRCRDCACRFGSMKSVTLAA